MASERMILSSLDVALLGKVAAIAYDQELLDAEQSAPEVMDLLRRCSEARAKGQLLAVGVTIRDILGEED